MLIVLPSARMSSDTNDFESVHVFCSLLRLHFGAIFQLMFQAAYWTATCSYSSCDLGVLVCSIVSSTDGLLAGIYLRTDHELMTQAFGCDVYYVRFTTQETAAYSSYFGSRISLFLVSFVRVCKHWRSLSYRGSLSSRRILHSDLCGDSSSMKLCPHWYRVGHVELVTWNRRMRDPDPLELVLPLSNGSSYCCRLTDFESLSHSLYLQRVRTPWCLLGTLLVSWAPGFLHATLWLLLGASWHLGSGRACVILFVSSDSLPSCLVGMVANVLPTHHPEGEYFLCACGHRGT